MSKLQNDIYQRFRGFKTVRRGDKKQGQSEWYYVDPRYDKDDDARRQIDVESENSPNPRLSDILANDMDENPQDYYIWRTKGDDKVRGAHAEREGKIFNRHVPPEGGNPGEDYNCRCWAEPYKLERYKDKPMIVDVSGILPEKVGTDKKLPEGSYTTEQGNMTTDVPVQFLKLPETEESDNQAHSVPLVPIPARKPKIAEPQTTANKIVPVPARKPLPENATLEDKLQRYIAEQSPYLQPLLTLLDNTNSYTTKLGKMTFDIMMQLIKNVENYAYAHRKIKFRSPEEEKLLRHMAKIVVKHEHIKQHPYLDTVGKITVGNGMNVNDWNLFKSVHWLIDEQPATEKEVKAMYDELCRQRERLQKEYDDVKKFKREHPEEYARWPKSKRKDNGPFNYTADHYAQFTNIRITEDEADFLMFSHLQDDYDTIKGYLDNFDNQPMGIKEAAFDIQYNTGNIRSFGKFKKAYNANDISGMAKESGRIIISKERNDDIKGRILKTK
ncbi:MAG: phage minor head protein [Alphaproteobacteria bacterium]